MAYAGMILLYLLVPAVVAVLGAAAATVRTPGPSVTSGVQHFAAGLVFAAVAVELLPDIVHERHPLFVAAGFIVGVVLMLVVRTAVAGSSRKGGDKPTGLILTVSIDAVVDGLLIGIAFTAGGAKEGLLLTAALTVEILFLGLSVATALGARTGRGKIIAITAGISGLLIIGGLAGALLLGGLSGTMLSFVLAFGSSALLFLVTEELLVEAHEVPESPATTAMFFAGFLGLLLVEMLAA